MQVTLLQRQRVTEAVMSFRSGEAVGGGGGKPTTDDDTGRSSRLLACSRQQTSTTCFAGDGGYWTIVFEVCPARCSGRQAFVAAFMNFIVSAIVIVHWDSINKTNSCLIVLTRIANGFIPTKTYYQS